MANSPGILIIGASAAGVSAAREARKAAPDATVTLVTEELHLPYHRPILTRRLADESAEHVRAFTLNPESFYRDERIDLVLSERIESLDMAGHTARASSGKTYPFDRLILATGSRPIVPSPGAAGRDNVFAVRTLDDAQSAHRCILSARHVAVIGGGLLGLEAADAVMKTGAKATVIEAADRLLSLQLDRESSTIVEATVRESGCRIVLGTPAKSIDGPDGHAVEVSLATGETIPADTVLFSVGVRPDTSLAAAHGIGFRRGITVNPRMETNVPGVYACGDAAEGRRWYGLWTPAVRQGAVAGRNAAGADDSFRDEDFPAMLSAFGTSVFSMGDTGVRGEPGQYQILERSSPDRLVTRKIFLRDGFLAGAISIGDTSTVQRMTKAVRDRIPEEAAHGLLD